jgi:hypothetical protein
MPFQCSVCLEQGPESTVEQTALETETGSGIQSGSGTALATGTVIVAVILIRIISVVIVTFFRRRTWRSQSSRIPEEDEEVHMHLAFWEQTYRQVFKFA